MDVIGVIDLRNGQAVHARGGVRDRYAPVRVPDWERDAAAGCLGQTGRLAQASPYVADGDAMSLARFYVDGLGIRELYVADLDAIENGRPQHALIDRLLGSGVPIWLDAGISEPGRAIEYASRGVSHVVVGLETLRSAAALAETVAALAGNSIAFSLDLRDGRPVTRIDEWTDSPETIAREVAAAGAGAVIVLDLARVGSGTGIDVGMLSSIRKAIRVKLLAGGGISGRDDLDATAGAGCDAVLAASALIDGRLTASDIRHARSRR